jgi:hypothetical protein
VSNRKITKNREKLQITEKVAARFQQEQKPGKRVLLGLNIIWFE